MHYVTIYIIHIVGLAFLPAYRPWRLSRPTMNHKATQMKLTIRE